MRFAAAASRVSGKVPVCAGAVGYVRGNLESAFSGSEPARGICLVGVEANSHCRVLLFQVRRHGDVDGFRFVVSWITFQQTSRNRMIFRLNQSIALWMLRFSRCSDESNVS